MSLHPAYSEELQIIQEKQRKSQLRTIVTLIIKHYLLSCYRLKKKGGGGKSYFQQQCWVPDKLSKKNSIVRGWIICLSIHDQTKYTDAIKQAVLLSLPTSKASKSYNLGILYIVMVLFHLCKTASQNHLGWKDL